jgi:hypothetical protein
MDTWISLVQSLIWPVFIGLILLAYRSWFRELLEVIKKRIESGSEVSIGPSGAHIGPAPKLESLPGETTPAQGAKATGPKHEKKPDEYIQLIHSATYNPAWSQKHNRPYYTICIHLDAYPPEKLDSVSRVVYHLHPTFERPEREITDCDTDFELKTFAYGQFNLTADVFFKYEKNPLRLSRYINF